jgi:hypothetical protein
VALIERIVRQFERKQGPRATFWEPLDAHVSGMPWGREIKGDVLNKVTMLVQDEAVLLDPDRLGTLYAQLGEAAAEDVICRAMEEMAVRLTCAERMYREDQIAGLRKTVRCLAAIADQVGMHGLARVARDVAQCIDGSDHNGLAATLARLLRVGERSLTAIWDLQDLSG